MIKMARILFQNIIMNSRDIKTTFQETLLKSNLLNHSRNITTDELK